MPSSDDSHLGPANRWCNIGFENIQTVELEDGVMQILTAPCLLATKFEAFHNRGGDYRTSHDFEDVIYVLDNRVNIVHEIEHDNVLVKTFLQEELIKVLEHPASEEILIYVTSNRRNFNRNLNKIRFLERWHFRF